MRGRRGAIALVVLLATAACTRSGPVEDPVGFDGDPSPRATPMSSIVPSPPPPSPTPLPSPTPSAESPTARNAAGRGAHGIVLTWDGIEIHLPSARVELVGLHQSNHDGARDLTAVAAPPVPVEVLPSRERGTGPRSAADIVTHPEAELRAPVTGTVVRAGTYTLYCDTTDDFVVIEPDGRPGIEVKLLHVDGIRVAAGDRVVAGETVLAPRPTLLPFRSQVDDASGPDDWPHVHLEVVDTSIPDRPNENSGSDDC